MKKLSYLFLFVLGLGCFTACDSDFLEEVQTNDLEKDVVFADSAYTAGFLNQLYADVGFEVNITRFNGGLQTCCDEAKYKQQSGITTDAQWTTGTVHPMTISSDAWDICYRNIRRANVFLKYVDNSMMVESQKTRYKAEARFLRAWYYSVLLRQYGGVPLQGDLVIEDVNNIELLNATRNTYADCVEYILSELKEAALYLPARATARDNGRASQGACHALAARVKLYAASPLFNGNADTYADQSDEMRALLGYPEYDKERWKAAAESAREVIALNRFIMYVRHADEDGNPEPGWGFYAIWKAKDWYNSHTEWDGITYPNGPYSGTIWSAKYGDGIAYEQTLRAPTAGGSGNGGYIYHDLVEAFPMLDGKPVGESKYERDLINPQVNRDPRFRNTVCWNGKLVAEKQAWGGSTTVYTYTGDGKTLDAIYDGTPTGYYIDKMCHRSLVGTMFPHGPQDRLLIRMADVLLMYAEAINEYYGPEHTEVVAGAEWGPEQVLKSIRARAGIEPGDDGMYGLKPEMTQDEMREAIRLERRLELAFEGHRFYDVRRWEIAEQTQNVVMHGYELTRDKEGNLNGRVIDVQQHVFRPAMYFWPLPYNEVTKNPTLRQNPYYE